MFDRVAYMREYLKKWRDKNKDKQKVYQERHWRKKLKRNYAVKAETAENPDK